MDSEILYKFQFNLKEGQLRRIQAFVNNWSRKKHSNLDFTTNWQDEIDYMLKGRGQLLPVNVKFDKRIGTNPLHVLNFIDINKRQNIYEKRHQIEALLKIILGGKFLL